MVSKIITLRVLNCIPHLHCSPMQNCSIMLIQPGVVLQPLEQNVEKLSVVLFALTIYNIDYCHGALLGGQIGVRTSHIH